MQKSFWFFLKKEKYRNENSALFFKMKSKETSFRKNKMHQVNKNNGSFQTGNTCKVSYLMLFFN
jgi:hypothetical protein